MICNIFLITVKENYKKVEKTALKNYDNAKVAVDKGLEQMKSMVDDIKKTIKTDTLTVPHPGLHERDFVIIPLAEIAGNMTIPGKGPLSTLIADCENHSVKKLVV